MIHILLPLFMFGPVTLAAAQVQGFQKLSATQGGLAGPLADQNKFGSGVAAIGDLNGEGVADLAVGAHLVDGTGFRQGAVWILFLNPDGTVRAEQEIGSGLH